MTISRRGFIAGLFAAPAIVKASSLMPVRVPKLWMGVDLGVGTDWTSLACLPPGEYNAVIDNIDIVLNQMWATFRIEPNVLYLPNKQLVEIQAKILYEQAVEELPIIALEDENGYEED